MSLLAFPLDRDEAGELVERWHRHHKRPIGDKFAIGAMDDEGRIAVVVIVGRPVSRMLDDGWTLEVTRLASDGTKNVCSFLYGSAWRAARALGYRRLVTYVLSSEPGTSLRAAGWKCLGEAGGGKWGRRARPRVDTHPTQTKMRWEMSLEPVATKPPALEARDREEGPGLFASGP